MGIPAHTFTRDWDGDTAVVLGNGTSLRGMDLSTLARPRVRVLVANGGYRTYPEADQLMCSDRHWLKANPDLSGFKGKMIVVTRPEAVQVVDPRMVHARRAFIEDVAGDIFANPRVLVEGHNSTSTNISAAVLRGVSRIILLGIDLQVGPKNRRRSYESVLDDPTAARVRYARQARHLTRQSMFVRARGVEVYNCSPRSALDCYPYIPLEDALL